jgi:putative transposase
VILSHRIALDPTQEQEAYFRQACGTARFVWNWALAEWDRQYTAGEKPTAAKLKKQFNAIKYVQFPWLEGIHRDAHAQPFANLQKAFSAFFKKTAKRPTRKKRGKCRDSFYVANDKFRITAGAAILPIVGSVRLTEELRFSGKIMSATISCEADRWFISIQVDVGDYFKPRTADNITGVDLGVKTTATLSDGQTIQSPRPLKTNLKRLKRAQRRLSRRQKGSNNRNKQRRKVAKIHARIKHIRADFLHKLTTKLCRENQTVVVEDLSVRGMLKLRTLSRSIADLGFFEFRRQLEYKSKIYGTNLILADRFFPSSKTCSSCGEIKEDLSLSDRVFYCPGCGLEADRDFNAALNLRTLGFRGIHACGPEGSGSFSERAKPRRVEAGTNQCSPVGTK